MKIIVFKKTNDFLVLLFKIRQLEIIVFKNFHGGSWRMKKWWRETNMELGNNADSRGFPPFREEKKLCG
ncbi:MAG: hypothetical protein LM550_08935 [Candidatus Contendobacter sp.]|jgi:hypothetical protein|nr:hypothetical protein [Gammaproteobacteria bacterium]MCC8993794.1 hypothetical protein [Candidatus Contendobacter sp.]